MKTLFALLLLIALPHLSFGRTAETVSGDVGASCSAAGDPGGEISFHAASIKGRPGFFRLAQADDGRWWFVTPNGRPFFYQGVCAINRAGTQGGRRAQPGPYAKTIDEKFDYQNGPAAFVAATFEKLRSWNFNATGAWTTAEFFDQGMPYTEILEFFHVDPQIPIPGRRGRLPDVFDDRWVRGIDEKARELCAPLRDSPDLVGYFTDNEIGFGQAEDTGFDPGFTAGTLGFALLRQVLALPGTAVHDAAWKLILARHGNDRARLAAAWGVNVREAADIQRLNENQTPIPGSAYAEDSRVFALHFAERYFRLAAEAIRRHDPNHLILGCRFGAPPEPWVLDAIAPHTDAISGNNYRPEMMERYDPVYRRTGLPILIGEFSWNTDLFRRVPVADEPQSGLSMAERMFRRGEATLVRTATHPGIVGYTWYRWVQPPSTPNRFTDGLVDHADEPDIHHLLLTHINAQLANIRKNHIDRVDGTSELIRLWLTMPDSPVVINQPIELHLDDGRFRADALGWNVRGRVRDGRLDATHGHVSIEADLVNWREPVPPLLGTAQLEITLERNGRQLTGQVKGQVGAKTVQGTVTGWYLEPIDYLPRAPGIAVSIERLRATSPVSP